MRFKNVFAIAITFFVLNDTKAQSIQYIKEFPNINHPEIGYWFFTPTLSQDERYLDTLKSIADRCKYTI